MTAQRKDEGIGERLRELRLEAGLSQADVAERLRVSEQWVSALERGVCNPGIVKVLDYCDGIDAYLHIGFDRPVEDYEAAPQIEHEPSDVIVRRLVGLAGGDPGAVERVCRDLYTTLLNRFTRQAMSDRDRQGEWLSEKIAAFLNDLANFAEDNSDQLRAQVAS